MSDEQPAPTARETAADELAEAEAVCREWLPFGRDGEAIYRVLAEYDERGRERDAARAEVAHLDAGYSRALASLDEARHALERLREELTRSESARLGLDYDLGAAQSERDAACAEVERLRATQHPEARANAHLTSEVERLRAEQHEVTCPACDEKGAAVANRCSACDAVREAHEDLGIALDALGRAHEDKGQDR